ncbi:hypothetical protein H4F33_19390 [Pectobacterium brasiliense]|uniref:hypothetical protein n=1 Tax=Pectobacterium brasiliense TaxID=180957 RepID=UPI0015E01BFD|nr:hypothetical protein [Pectobacterium brasiliense]MBA0218562.1 hypothetical protein [Pectobacterium brasiliense]MBN3074231.1 hypothetical protein [Pectobacterium brasiliense]MBN3169264.1 hypothetical protein [Pectobacterium brasiliense]
MEMKFRVIVLGLSIIFGVPISILGYEWMMVKLNKQTLNCISDVHHAVMSLSMAEGAHPDDWEEQGGIPLCLKRIQFKKFDNTHILITFYQSVIMYLTCIL